jgi:hypothetical protein
MAKRLFDTYSEAEQIKTLYRAINHVLDNENIKDIDEVYKIATQYVSRLGVKKSDFMLIHNMPIHQIILKVKEKK